MWNLKNIRIIIRIVIPLIKAVVLDHVFVVVGHQQSIVTIHFKVHWFGWDSFGGVEHVCIIALKYCYVVRPLCAQFAIYGSITRVLRKREKVIGTVKVSGKFPNTLQSEITKSLKQL